LGGDAFEEHPLIAALPFHATLTHVGVW